MSVCSRSGAVLSFGQVVGPAVRDDLTGGTVQVEGAAVVAESLPGADRVTRRRGRERLRARPAVEPGQVIRDHALRVRLLEHHLRDEDRVGIARAPPGKVAPEEVE